MNVDHLELLFKAMAFGSMIISIGIIYNILNSYKNDTISKLNFIVTGVLSVIIVLVSWFFNFGYLRVFMTAILVPFIHAIAFLTLNFLTANYLPKSKKLRTLSLLCMISYLLAYLVLPDGVDETMYLFFGFIKNNSVANICNIVSLTLFIGNILLFVLQIIELIKTRKLL